MIEPCPLHEDLSRDIKQLLQTAVENKIHIDEIFKFLGKLECAITNHIDISDKPGGVRERVMQLELQVGVIKRGYWKVGLASGIIGALIGHLTPSSIKLVAMFLKFHLGG